MEVRYTSMKTCDTYVAKEIEPEKYVIFREEPFFDSLIAYFYCAEYGEVRDSLIKYVEIFESMNWIKFMSLYNHMENVNIDTHKWKYPWLGKVAELVCEYLTLDDGLESAKRSHEIPDKILSIVEREL